MRLCAKKSPLTLGLAGAFLGTLAGNFFMDAMAFRWYWAPLALVLVVSHNTIELESEIGRQKPKVKIFSDTL